MTNIHSDANDHYSLSRSIFRRFVHWASHRFILSSRRVRRTRLGDIDIVVPPSVFHAGVFVTSRFFARFLRCQDFRGMHVAEIGSGTGILSISAALAGASKVVALDINPAAVEATAENARRNAVGSIIDARLSNLFEALAPEEKFDVIISSPPSFAGEPKDMADRAWVAGPGYDHLKDLFKSAVMHLTGNGRIFLLLSSDTNVSLFRQWSAEAGLTWDEVGRKSIWVEEFLLFSLSTGQKHNVCRLPTKAEERAAHDRRRIYDERRTVEALALAIATLEGRADHKSDVQQLSGLLGKSAFGPPDHLIGQARARLTGPKAGVTHPQTTARSSEPMPQ